MQRKIAALITIASMSAGASAAMAQQREPETARTFRVSSPSSTLFSGFGEDERRLITDWFRDSNNLNGLPAAIAKPEHLPAGVQKQLMKNATLPEGLERRIQPLPRALEMRLPRMPIGRRRVAIGGNVILLDELTSMIVDIIPGVL